MRRLLIPVVLVVLALVVFAAYPLVNEGTKSSCKALERRAVTLVSLDGGPESLIITALARQLLRQGKGRIAAEFSRQRNPDVPVALSCTINYWHSLLDKGWLAAAIQQNLN